MPYIEEEERKIYRPLIRTLIQTVKDETRDDSDKLGPVNYIITSVLLGVFHKRRYFTFVLVLGTLFCVALEYYRRRVAKYEDEKIKENGDVY